MGAYQNPWIVIVFTPPIFILTAFYTLSKVINLGYPDKPFSVDKHENKAMKYWTNMNARPTVDILLPVAGEDIEVIDNTWQGVSELFDQYGENMKVYVLDDKGDNKLKTKARSFGFNYICRPNRGEFKKSGNLNYGLSQVDGEFIVVFDADFRPSPMFLHDLMPYTEDKKVGIVQSPQYFDVNKQVEKRSLLEYGGGAIQAYFYTFVQPSLNKLNATICVGSNAIYRREALDDVGGFALLDHSEDVWTGFNLIKKYWQITYVPVILAKGLCPDDVQAFFNQQRRWSEGSLSIMSSGSFWTSDFAWKTRLGYLSSFLYYLSDTAGLVMSFLLFASIFTFGLTFTSNSLWILMAFVVTSFFLLIVHQYPKARLGTLIAFNVAVWSYIYSILSFYTGNGIVWQPTGVKRKLSSGFRNLLIISTLYYVVYFELTLLIINNKLIFIDRTESLPALFWICLVLFIQTCYMIFIWRYAIKRLVLEFAKPK